MVQKIVDTSRRPLMSASAGVSCSCIVIASQGVSRYPVLTEHLGRAMVGEWSSDLGISLLRVPLGSPVGCEIFQADRADVNREGEN